MATDYFAIPLDKPLLQIAQEALRNGAESETPRKSNRGVNLLRPLTDDPVRLEEIHIDAEIIDTSADIDYITLSFREADHHLISLVNEIFFMLHRKGNDYQRSYRRMYEGRQSGQFFYGESYQGALIVASGSLAPRIFRIFAGLADNCSRIDLRQDVKFSKYLRDYALRQCATWDRMRDFDPDGTTPSKNGRGSKFVLHRGSGDTLEIGSRKSDVFARFYDKQQEAKRSNPDEAEKYKNVWRWELELKGDSAKAVWTQLAHGKFNKFVGTVDREVIAATVYEWFASRCFTLPPLEIIAKKLSLRLTGKVPSTASSKLKWLRKQVRGTVDFLQKEGYTQELLEALGILEYYKKEVEHWRQDNGNYAVYVYRTQKKQALWEILFSENKKAFRQVGSFSSLR